MNTFNGVYVIDQIYSKRDYQPMGETPEVAATHKRDAGDRGASCKAKRLYRQTLGILATLDYPGYGRKFPVEVKLS